MLRKLDATVLKDPVWLRIATLSIILFFVFLGDAILSFWAPDYMEDVFESSLVMGIIMSFSSVVGFLADLIMPQLLRGITVKKLLIAAIVSSIGFAGILMFTTWWPLVVLFLIGMAVWGVYYEFLSFASQQFVADSTPLRLHSASWAIIGTFRSLAYFLGPIVTAWLLLSGDRTPLIVAIAFTLLGLVILLLTQRRHDRSLAMDVHSINLLSEISHWKILFVHVWPVLIISLLIGLVDAAFWSVGAVYTHDLGELHFMGSWFLSLYMLPSLFIGFVVAKWNIYSGKKKLAETFLLGTGISLALFYVSDSVPWLLFMVLISSICAAVAIPLVDAVYSDIVARMGRERKHMIGLSSSTFSVAYIIGPIIAGYISEQVGERNTFAIIGLVVLLVSVVLLFVTPKKLRLPQVEIKKWEQTYQPKLK